MSFKCYTQSSSDVNLTSFEPVSVDEVVAAVRALPDKSCALDPLPAPTLKSIINDLAPFLTELFNRSLSTGCVPAVFKAAYISPHLKKVDLDSSDVRSYRPISNLSVLSKLLKWLVARQLLAHLNSIKRSATQTPVGVSGSSFNRDRCVEGFIGHSSCSRRGRFVCTGFVGYIGGLRHGRSWNSSA